MTEAEKLAREWLIQKTQEADVVELIHRVAERTRIACLKAVYDLTTIYQVDDAIRKARWEREKS